MKLHGFLWFKLLPRIYYLLHPKREIIQYFSDAVWNSLATTIFSPYQKASEGIKKCPPGLINILFHGLSSSLWCIKLELGVRNEKRKEKEGLFGEIASTCHYPLLLPPSPPKDYGGNGGFGGVGMDRVGGRGPTRPTPIPPSSPIPRCTTTAE